MTSEQLGPPRTINFLSSELKKKKERVEERVRWVPWIHTELWHPSLNGLWMIGPYPIIIQQAIFIHSDNIYEGLGQKDWQRQQIFA